MTQSAPATLSKFRSYAPIEAASIAACQAPFIPIGLAQTLPSLASVFTLTTNVGGLTDDQRSQINCVFINVVAQSVRFLWGANPSASAGFLINTGNFLLMLPQQNAALPRFIETAASATGVYQFGRLV